MSARIIDRGRGPEIEGTRVTVYRIMDFIRENSSPTCMANELNLSSTQVRAALDYIAEHRLDVEAEYDKILKRVQQSNTAPIEAGRAQSADALKQRIRSRRLKDVEHADFDG